MRELCQICSNIIITEKGWITFHVCSAIDPADVIQGEIVEDTKEIEQ